MIKVRVPALVAVFVGLSLALAAGCEPRTADRRDPCPGGCQVEAPVPMPRGELSTGDPLYVPQCHDVDGERGPCVDQVGDSGMWIFVPVGNRWPLGTRVDPCPNEGGGPSPCAWVIDPSGGDAGVWVYGVNEA